MTGDGGGFKQRRGGRERRGERRRRACTSPVRRLVHSPLSYLCAPLGASLLRCARYGHPSPFRPVLFWMPRCLRESMSRSCEKRPSLGCVSSLGGGLEGENILFFSRSYGGRECGAVAPVLVFGPAVLTRFYYQSISTPCLGHKNRTRGAAQGPSKPRNRQLSQPGSPKVGPRPPRWPGSDLG